MKKTFRHFLAAAVVAFALFPACSSLAERIVPEYHKEVLDNGATIVASYIEDSPMVTVQVRVLSGLSNEGKYAGSGISHFLEHLLFKATDGMSSVELSRAIKAMGGRVNGSTGLDSAEYHITVPNEHFDEAMGLIVDLVMDPVFTEEEIETERQIILKEINLREDDPSSRQMRLLFEQAYRQHVYKYPIIGYKDLVSSLKKDDLMEYHSAVYTPDRIVLGISGGVPPGEAISLGREKLKGYTRGRIWQNNTHLEPRQVDSSIFSFQADTVVGYMAMGFHTTSLYSQDLYPVDVMSIILGTGNDSRMHNRLVKEKQLLYSVSSFNLTPRYPGLFVITGIGEPEKLEQARKEIFKVIEEFKAVDVSGADLERAKNMVISGYLQSHESIGSIVSSMTNSQMLTSDPSFFEKYVEGIEGVTSSDVNVAAWRYLSEDNSTTVYLLPDVNMKVEAAAYGPQEQTIEETKEKVLANGLRIIARRKGQLPLVSVTFASLGGLLAETRTDNGISNLTASLMLKGTRKRTEAEIEPAIERLGGDISSFSGMNSLGISMDLMAKDLDKGLEIFQDVVTGPIFPEEEVSKEKSKIMAAIREQEKDIFSAAMLKARKILYGEHPYSMRGIGEVSSLESLDRESITAFYLKSVSPANSVITVVGDIDPAKMIEDLSDRFSSWPKRTVSFSEKTVKTLGGSVEESLYMQKQQAVFLAGFQGVELGDDRKYALDVISSLLSGEDGRLFRIAREDEGLAYASGAVNVPLVDKGYFVLYIATTEQKLARARRAVLDALRSISEDTIGEDDIISSKKRLIADRNMSLQTNSSISTLMTLNELYGLGAEHYRKYPEKINSVTREEITRVAGQILDIDKAVMVEVHSEGKAQPSR
jgi:zinc protease